jgi:hypothetical protein
VNLDFYKFGVAPRIQVSLSSFWSGDLKNAGERLFGLSLIDDPNHVIDPRDRPVWIGPLHDR